MSRRRKRKEKNNNLIGIIAIILLIIYILISRNSSNTNEDTIAKTDGYDAIVFVVGNVENSPAPAIEDNETITSAVSQVFYNTESGATPNVYVVSATADPVAIDIESKYLIGPAKNEIASKSNLKTLMKGINLAVNSSPSSAGADYFSAIILAGDYVKDFENPLIIVYGSGLSDSGIINFAFNDVIINQNNDENYTINLLQSNKRIVENAYSNISLVWYGIGQGINEQPDLKEWRTVVKQVYTDALSYLGISSKFNTITVSSSTDSVETDYDVNITTVDAVTSGYTMNLTERIVGFKADSATISNLDETKELLTSFASKFTANGYKIVITGYQTECATTETLGKERAEAVKNVLVSLGIDESKIETVGVAGPPDDREESPKCGSTGIASEHRTVRVEVVKA